MNGKVLIILFLFFGQLIALNELKVVTLNCTTSEKFIKIEKCEVKNNEMNFVTNAVVEVPKANVKFLTQKVIKNN
jgi:hypothetical protein